MLIGVSLDHRRADLALRERFFLSEVERAGLGAAAEQSGTGLVLLATCNRVELYGWVPAANAADAFARLSVAARRLSPRLGADYLSRTVMRQGQEAARHLFRVAAGLESQVSGDIQVLGQVRDAYRLAAEAGAAGPELHRLFQSALRAGRRVHTETTLGATRATVASQALRVAEGVLGPLHERRAVVLGCGSVGRSAARRLAERGARVTLINRTDAVAATLARKLTLQASIYPASHEVIAASTLTVVATAAPTPTVQADRLARARAALGPRMPATLILDLSMPRNVEPAVGHFPAITLLDLHHLSGAGGLADDRRAALRAADTIVEEELTRLMEWSERRAERRRDVA